MPAVTNSLLHVVLTQMELEFGSNEIKLIIVSILCYFGLIDSAMSCEVLKLCFKFPHKL